VAKNTKEEKNMVDFNNEATVSAAATDILRILILQRRNDVIDAMERYHMLSENSEPSCEVVRSRLFSFYLEIQAMLKRKYDNSMHKDNNPCKYKDLKDTIGQGEFKELEAVYLSFNEFLDANRLTRIDTKQIYDSTRVVDEDKEKGI
jgi:hypothetical protein